MIQSAEIVKRNRTFWRGMYLVALVIGVVIPIATIIAAGTLTDDMLRGQPMSDSTFMALLFIWSAATLFGVLGVSCAAWIIMSTAQQLGLDQERGYLRSMFFMAIAAGGIVPCAGIIAVGVMTQKMSIYSTWILILSWCGMIAVCLAGLFSATWLIKSAATKLRPHQPAGSQTEMYHPQYPADPQTAR
jgi:hypothetical protein